MSGQDKTCIECGAQVCRSVHPLYCAQCFLRLSQAVKPSDKSDFCSACRQKANVWGENSVMCDSCESIHRWLDKSMPNCAVTRCGTKRFTSRIGIHELCIQCYSLHYGMIKYCANDRCFRFASLFNAQCLACRKK